ncbi:UPF0158 family protein [Pedobacter cryotolerans]|uniref:Uncharacterized protein n=1 Tax=Pedobacter cryotolerans TaxID=2571270 RepID=A0A4U1BZ25_9SPHI|nr:UPF0158 family protein [Pedobacter cryotolerans]TKB98020.1 hypothetical protein FA045_15260 [Pedobacter cryotolerans]
MQPTPSQIKEITEQLDCGFCCYYNKISGEVVSIPDFEDTIDDIAEFYGEDLAKIKKDKKNFVIITKPSSREGFEIMEDFAQQLTDEMLQKKLLDALEKKRPFAHFKAIIEDASDYRQQWFDFKLMKLQVYILNQIPKVKQQ